MSFHRRLQFTNKDRDFLKEITDTVTATSTSENIAAHFTLFFDVRENKKVRLGAPDLRYQRTIKSAKLEYLRGQRITRYGMSILRNDGVKVCTVCRCGFYDVPNKAYVINK